MKPVTYSWSDLLPIKSSDFSGNCSSLDWPGYSVTVGKAQRYSTALDGNDGKENLLLEHCHTACRRRDDLWWFNRSVSERTVTKKPDLCFSSFFFYLKKTVWCWRFLLNNRTFASTNTRSICLDNLSQPLTYTKAVFWRITVKKYSLGDEGDSISTWSVPDAPFSWRKFSDRWNWPSPILEY